MTKSVKVLKTVCWVLAVVLLAVAVCVIIANSQNDLSAPAAELSCWMKMIKDDTFLKNVAIPGAHDAGTKGISYLAATQDRDTAQLLACGTRYLDLRVAQTRDGLKIYHGPFKGVTLDSVLNAVKEFLKNNDSETVLLDFQHFDGDAQEGALRKTEQLFVASDNGGMLICNDGEKTDAEFVDGLTIAQCRGKCLVLWGGDKADDYVKLPYIFKRNNDGGTRENSVLHSYYESALNKKSSKTYVNEALPHYIEMYQRQNSGLFVLQGQLTDGLFVFGPHFREATHNVNMNGYLQNLDEETLRWINVVIRDYVSPRKNCLTLKLNLQKGIVEKNCEKDFEKALAKHTG